ncbi:MAG TPA: zf-TFIIB domain-containing protein [Vicinamibacteria bacterium]
MDDLSRKREDDWFLQHEKKLLEDARKAREKREAERKAKETEDERKKLREQHFMRCPKCGHDMKPETLEGIEIDRCSFCEGVYFDQGEIEELFLKRGQSQRQSFMRRLLRM